MIDKFKKLKVLVVGDVMLDEYIIGDVNRMSPEAPVPIVDVISHQQNLGGAANVASNILALGAECLLIGRVGSDKTGDDFMKLINKSCFSRFIIKQNSYRTTKKTRIIARNQQLARIDDEEHTKIDDSQVREIMKVVKKNTFDIIILSDYCKGMITFELVKELKKLGKLIVADPKPKNIQLYRGVYAITPNLYEAKMITKKEAVNHIGKYIVSRFRTNLVLTMGKEGVAVFSKDNKKPFKIEARVTKPRDVSGAGDTFISAFALSIASGMNINDAAITGNVASGIAVEKFGVSTTSFKELSEALKC